MNNPIGNIVSSLTRLSGPISYDSNKPMKEDCKVDNNPLEINPWPKVSRQNIDDNIGIRALCTA